MSLPPFIDENLTQRGTDILIFIVTMVAMGMGMSSIPLLPAPLPLILAFLIAFTAYKDPKSGTLTGSFIIGFGLIYHLSRINFFQLFPLDIKLSLIVLIFLPFMLMPTALEEYMDVLSVDLGIIASCLLFSYSFFYLAIPLILIFATIYRKGKLGLTIGYYVFISIPLQIMQFLKTFQPGELPPLYAPLNTIYLDIQESMSKVSLTELAQVLRTISMQITESVQPSELMREALLRYLDSLPGMIFFLFIISSLISATAFFTLKIPDVLRGLRLPDRYLEIINIILPSITASITNIFFFSFLVGLQSPLAFRTDVNQTTVFSGLVFTLALSIPISVSQYMINLRNILQKRAEQLEMITRRLLTELKKNLGLVNKLHSPLPDQVSEIRNRMLITKDELEYTLDRSFDKTADLKELNEQYNYVNNTLRKRVHAFPEQLDLAVEDQFVKIRYEYLQLINMIKELGFQIEVQEIPSEESRRSLESKIDGIEKIHKAGRVATRKLIQEAEEIYKIISSLYDPSLPEVSPTIQISKQKVEEDEPWIVIDALLQSIKNWERQYAEQIDSSIKQISSSVSRTADLAERREELWPLIGPDYKDVEMLADRIQQTEIEQDSDEYKVLRVIRIRDAIYASTKAVGKILQVLYQKLKGLEEEVEQLIPVDDYRWNSNITLLDRMETSLDMILKYENYRLDEILENLYRSNSQIEEALETMKYYNERREMLLNYGILERKIEKVYNQKEKVEIRDLPVEEKYAEEYLKLYYNQHFPELSYDESTKILQKRA